MQRYSEYHSSAGTVGCIQNGVARGLSLVVGLVGGGSSDVAIKLVSPRATRRMRPRATGSGGLNKMWKRKRSVDQIRFTDISSGQGDLAERLALQQFDDERTKSQIRETEKVLRERRHETIELVLYAVAGLAAGVTIMTAIAKLLGW